VRVLYPLLLLLICFSASLGQSVSTPIGARANGIAYASASLFDAWGVFGNPASTAKTEILTTAFTYDLHPSLPGGNRTAAVINFPVNIGVVNAGVYRFGDALYNEQLVSAGFSGKLGLAALGAQVNYIQYTAEGFGTKGVVSINFGGIAELTPKLSVGAYIHNINQPEIANEEKLPTRMVAGLAFKPIDKVFISTELEKDLEYDPSWRTGIEYLFHKKFCARTGYRLNPNTAFFGLGFKSKKLTIDYAIQHNVSLSLSHQASISYAFGKL
jgi:hypothetical protein